MSTAMPDIPPDTAWIRDKIVEIPLDRYLNIILQQIPGISIDPISGLITGLLPDILCGLTPDPITDLLFKVSHLLFLILFST
jgi:hypothetical protein